MKKFTRYITKFKAMLFTYLLVGLTISLYSMPQNFNIFEKYRSGRYSEIKNHYGYGIPPSKISRYILAKSLLLDYEKALLPIKNTQNDEPLPKNAQKIIYSFLSVLNIYCNDIKNEETVINCLNQGSFEKFSNHIDRISILEAYKVAIKLNMRRLGMELLARTDLNIDDPISRMILDELLTFHYNSKNYNIIIEIAENFTGRLDETGTLIGVRARHAIGEKNDSLKLFLELASKTNNFETRKIIYNDLKSMFPDLFSERSLKIKSDTNRDLLQFSEHLSRSEISSLKKIYPPLYIARSSSPERVRQDGFFLIKSRESDTLEQLGKVMHSHLSKNNEIIIDWIKQLNWDKDEKNLDKIFKLFPHAIRENYYTWTIYLNHLEKKGKKKIYFNELVSFTKKYHYDSNAYDLLVQFLIGDNPEKPNWANDEYWKIALKDLPNQTGTGRFLFWFKQLMNHKNNTAGVEKLNDEFYERSPGSYYAHEFWKETDSQNFVAEWFQVKTRNDYLKWISRHGGNETALKFLSRQNFSKFYDINSLLFWKEVNNSIDNIPEEILDFYKLGEYDIANQLFDHHYSKKDSLTQWALKFASGRKSENHFISVYFLRHLLRNLNIPEDPYSLPLELLTELYPRPYLHIAQKYSKIYQIDTNMIYALMRQESMFRELAVSRSGASGLMQVMPSTGAWLASMMKIKDYDLHDPEISIHMGVKFFSDLLQKNQADFRRAAIAYNGGPGNLRKWEKRYYKGDMNRFLEYIPYKESRDYCRKTYQNYQHYNITYNLHQ